MLLILFPFKSVLQFLAIALHKFQKYTVWKNIIHQKCAWRYSSTGMTPVDMPAKAQQSPIQDKFEPHPAFGAQSYKQTSQRFHNNQEKKQNLADGCIMTVQSRWSLCVRAPSVGVTWPQWEYFLLWQMLMTGFYKSCIVTFFCTCCDRLRCVSAG